MQTGDTPYTRLPPANAAASPLHRRPSVLALAGAVAISCGLLGSVAVRRSAPGGELDLRSGRQRLRFVNGCQKDDIWLAGTAVAVPLFTPDVKLGAGEEYAFTVPDAGLASTRFWPKWGCNEAGQMCAIGQSGGPGEACAPEGCAPPVDSKFEARRLPGPWDTSETLPRRHTHTTRSILLPPPQPGHLWLQARAVALREEPVRARSAHRRRGAGRARAPHRSLVMEAFRRRRRRLVGRLAGATEMWARDGRDLAEV